MRTEHRKRLCGLIAGLCLAVASGPASSAWSDTTWGMSAEQVRALYPDLADKVDAGFTGKHFQATQKPKPFLGLAIDEADFTILVRQGLRQVVLQTAQKTPAVETVMRKAFGKPVSVVATPYLRICEFFDLKSKDQLLILQGGSGGTVIRIRPMTDEQIKSLKESATL
jgi:hypothetical protein